MFGFLKAKTPSHPLDGGDPWKGRLAFAAIVLVVAFYAMQLIINLQTLWLLVFGAVVVAVILRALADPIRRWTRIKDALAVFASLLIVVLLIAGGLGVLTATLAALWTARAVLAPVRRLSEAVKSVDGSESVKVSVAVSPSLSRVLSADTTTAGRTPS